MEVLFDLQQELETLDLNSSDLIVPVGDELPTLKLSIVDDVKTILVKDRRDRATGLGISLRELPDVRAGDRITITGRVPRDTLAGSWGVALWAEDSETRNGMECQLAHQVSPRSLFALSHILCSEDLNSMIMVQTTRWRAMEPIMNLYIDSILISRSGKSVQEDPRTVVYSLETDRLLKSCDNSGGSYEIETLMQSGSPHIKITVTDSERSIYVSERAMDWDGLDIKLQNMGLLIGNKYSVTVTGETAGNVPNDAVIALQGLPGYSWRGNVNMESKSEFTLRHTMTHAEVELWQIIRITTNAQGATVPFYIRSIEIKRLGLL